MVEELSRIARERIPFKLEHRGGYEPSLTYNNSYISLGNRNVIYFKFAEFRIINEDTIRFRLTDNSEFSPYGFYIENSLVIGRPGVYGRFFNAYVVNRVDGVHMSIYYINENSEKFDIWLNDDNLLGFVPRQRNRGFTINPINNISSISSINNNSFIDFKTVISKVAKNRNDYDYLNDRCRIYLRQNRRERLLQFLDRLKYRH